MVPLLFSTKTQLDLVLVLGPPTNTSDSLRWGCWQGKYITPYGGNTQVSVVVFLPRAWWPPIQRTGNEESLPLLQKEYRVLPVHALKNKYFPCLWWVKCPSLFSFGGNLTMGLAILSLINLRTMACSIPTGFHHGWSKSEASPWVGSTQTETPN